MNRLVMSLSGEGRGHAARAATVLESLQADCEILVLAPKSVQDFLSSVASTMPHVKVGPLPSLRFAYRRTGNLSYSKSWLTAAPFLYNLQSHLRTVSNAVEQFEPDLLVCDFEPLLPRVARKLGLPLLSLDHQHFLSALDLSCLPRHLRWKAAFLRPSVKLFCPSADRYLVSSFYRYPQRPGTEHYEQVGVLLRNSLGQHASKIGEHLLVYVRREETPTWVQELHACGLPVRIYGSHRQGRDGLLDYRPICSRRFVEDLVSCRALVCTAGNQLIGEALSVGKPVLAIPEHGNFEQQLNGHFLRSSGMGQCIPAQQMDWRHASLFIEHLDEYREQLTHYHGGGNAQILATIRSMLPSQSQAPAVATPRKAIA